MSTDPTVEPLRFAYWVPNVSGGLVTSTIEQRTDWSFEYNRKLARLAERAGFDYALSQVRYTASYGCGPAHRVGCAWTGASTTAPARSRPAGSGSARWTTTISWCWRSSSAPRPASS